MKSAHLDDIINKLQAEEDQVNDSMRKAMEEQEKMNKYLGELGGMMGVRGVRVIMIMRVQSVIAVKV